MYHWLLVSSKLRNIWNASFKFVCQPSKGLHVITVRCQASALWYDAICHASLQQMHVVRRKPHYCISYHITVHSLSRYLKRNWGKNMRTDTTDTTREISSSHSQSCSEKHRSLGLTSFAARSGPPGQYVMSQSADRVLCFADTTDNI